MAPSRIKLERGTESTSSRRENTHFSAAHSVNTSNVSQRGRGRALAGRSDAPTPSERPSTEPLLMQVNNIHVQESQRHETVQMDSFRDFAPNLREFNKTLGELHSIGVQHDVQLPELVLLGDQSAGKSSLMSGLAGFNLPRSDGCCTRCVTHIRVSSHAEWSCRVSLRISYAYDRPDSGILRRDVTDQNPFPPWRRINQQTTDFKTIQNPSEIEDVLKWAQIAILNPNSPASHYIPGSGHVAMQPDALQVATEAVDGSGVKFSPNVIALEIKGPEYPELSFYDLPGVFANSETERDLYTTEVVKRLARAYIRHDAAILIWAVPMNVDPAISNMGSLIRDENALDRTIGVITKADLFQDDPSSRTQWLKVLRGETFRTGHGYYVTSRKSHQVVDEQDKWEAMFFGGETGSPDQADDHWPPIGFNDFSLKCGVDKLKEQLSNLVGAKFKESLPQVKEKVSEKLRKAKAELKELPEPPQNPELEIHKSLADFASCIKSSLRPGNEFDRRFHDASKEFHRVLTGLKPKVKLAHSMDAPNAGVAADKPIELIDDDEATPTPTHLGKRKMAAPPVTPSKHPKFGEDFKRAPSASPSVASTTTASFSRNLFLEPLRPSDVTKAFAKYKPLPAKTLDDIRQVKEKGGPAGMPGVTDLSVYRDLCAQSVMTWEGPVLTFLELVVKMVRETIEAGLQHSFSSLKKRAVFAKCEEAMARFLTEQESETRALLEKHLDIQTSKVFTLNKEDLDRLWKEELECLHHYRHHMRWRAYNSGSVVGSYMPLDQIPVEKRTAEERDRRDQARRMGADQFEDEINIFSYVRANYRLAVARFIDSAALILYSDMLPAIETKLVEELYLSRELGVIPHPTQETYASLMAEEESITSQRVRVQRDIGRFKKAMDSIGQLEAKISRPANGGRSYPTPRSDSETELVDEL